MTHSHFGLPTTPGAVVWIDGDRAMLTKFGNWVTEGVFTLTPEQVDAERWTILFDPEQGCSLCEDFDPEWYPAVSAVLVPAQEDNK